MAQRAVTTSLLLIVAVIALTCIGGIAQTGRSGDPQLQPRRVEKCPPSSVALISPEFVVLEKAPEDSTFVLSSQCFDKNSKLFLVDEKGASISLDVSTPPDTPERQQSLTATASLPAPGLYTVCIADAKASQCGSHPAGPTVVVMAGSDCSDPVIPASLTRLPSETPMPEPESPGIAGKCDYHPAYADKAIMIDAESGRTCTSPSAESPDDGCFENKKPEKKPLQLGAGDAVRLYVTKKNPFLHDYKFASTDSQIKDDDIGTFLNVLVPGLSSGAGQKGSDKGGAASTATAALNKEMLEASQSTRVAVSALASEDLSQATPAVKEAETQQREAHDALETQVLGLHPAAPERQTVESTLAMADTKLNEVEQRTEKIPQKPKEKQQDAADIRKALDESFKFLEQAQAALPKKETAPASAVHSCVSHLSDRVDNLVTNYAYFARAYNRERTYLLSDDRTCQQLAGTAVGLWRLISYAQAKILDAHLDLGLRDGMGAVAAGTPPVDPKQKDQPLTSDQKLMSADSKRLTASFCTLKAIRKEIAPVLNAAASGLEKVLVNPNAFRSEILIGPYADATQFDWTLQKTMTQPPINPIDTAAFNSALDDCLSKGSDQGSTPEQNPKNPKNPKTPKTGASDNSETRLHWPASLVNISLSFPSAAADDSQDDTGSSSTKKKKTKSTGDDSSGDKQKGQQSPTDSSTTTRGRRINFGSERFIVSAGLTGSPLGLREFGKGVGQAFDASGKPISGQETANIITLKTDQGYRLSPMLFLNSRIYQWSGRAEALYATFGITAKSDSNGTAPEYVIGLSQSFLQRHLLFTAGVYAGRQQKLTGGLYVNEAIPSNLTGDIPTQSNYRINAGFSVSWRIPGLAK
jgi:hypothetical protein